MPAQYDSVLVPANDPRNTQHLLPAMHDATRASRGDLQDPSWEKGTAAFPASFRDHPRWPPLPSRAETQSDGRFGEGGERCGAASTQLRKVLQRSKEHARLLP